MTTLLVAGGQVLRPDMTVERADVLLDAEAGEILAVDEPAEMDAAADETLEATDSLVIPGLVNAHTHVAMTLLRGVADDKPLGRWLEEDIWPVEAELTPEDVRAGAELGIVEMLRSGTTAFSDMYFHVEEIAEAVEATGIKAVLGHTAITVGKDEAVAAADVERSVETAADLDGAADGRISTTIQPHSLTTVGEHSLAALADAGAEADRPLHFHANETADEVAPIVEDQGQRPLAWAEDLGLLGEDTFLAHCVHVDESELDLLAETGTGVVHCPASNMKLASGMAPVQAMLDRDVPVGIGTDGAASNNDLDVFDELRDAAMVGKLAADDASAVAAEDAIRMATAGGAELLGLDAGRIEPGAAADLAVIDLEAAHLTPRTDLVSHLAYAVRGSDVRHTICDGQVVVRDREVTTVDEAAVRRRASEHAAGLLERAGA